MRPAARALALVAAGALATWWLARPAPTDPVAETLAANSHQASLAGIRARRTSDSLARAALEIERMVIHQAATIRRLGARVDTLLAANDALLADTAAVPADTLRMRLAATTAAFRDYRARTDGALASVDSLLGAHLAERAAVHAERAAHAAERAALAAERDHWKRRATCTLGPVRCPTRTATAVGTLLLTLLLL